MEGKVVNQSNIRKADPVSMLKKNAMLIVLVLVYIFFTAMTQGRMFKPNSFASLINQNAYVYILGCGMLMCMLTGGKKRPFLFDKVLFVRYFPGLLLT